MALKPRAPFPEEKYVSVLTTSQFEEFGLRPHSSNGVNGDHNGDLALDAEEEEEDGGGYLEEDPDDGTAASKPANGSSLTDKLSSAKAALLNFRLPTATELKNNYINSNFHKSLNQPLVVKTRVEPPEVQKSRQVLTQEKGPAQLSQIHGLADLPLPKINLLEVSHEDKGEEAGGSVKNGSILNLQSFSPMNTLPRSLREQNIQTACKECPADDEELTKRMELTKTMTPSQLAEIHSLADFPVPSRLKHLFDKTAAKESAEGTETDGDAAATTDANALPVVGGLYGTLPRSLRETKLITMTKVEADEDVLAARRALVEAKSPAELSAIHSLADLPIPATLERMVRRGRTTKTTASAPGSRLDVRSLSIKEVNIRNLIPESLKVELAVSSQVETNREQVDQRRRLVQERTVTELAHIGSLADLPIPTPLMNLWKGEQGPGRRSSQTSGRSEKRLRNLTVGAIFSADSPFLPESMKETKLVVRSKVEEVDPVVLAARQQLVKTSTPAELSRINGFADLPVPARLRNLHLHNLTGRDQTPAHGGEDAAGSRPSSPPFAHQNGGGSSLYNSLPRSLRDQQLIVRCRTDDADNEDLKRRQELTRTMTPAQLSEISSISDLPIPAKLESLIKSVSHVENSSGESPSAPPRQKWKKEDIYESLPSSLKSELIVRSRNIVDDDELKQRQELIRSHTPSQLSEIHSLKDFPVPKFIEQHLHKNNDDKKVEEEGAAKEPFSIYESLVPASLKTNLVVKTVMEEPHIQAERAEAVKAKSVNELSQIHSLSDLPVPSTLMNLAKKGYAPVQRKKKFKEQMSELKSQSTQSLAQSIQSTLHATLPRSLSEKQLLVRSRVEQPDVLAERRRLVESKAVSELSQLSSFHDLPVPTPLSKFFHKSMEKLDSLAMSFKSFSTNDLAVRSAAAAEEEEGGRPVSRFSLHSELYASLPRSLKEQVLVRTKVEEDEAVLRERQALVQSKSPAELAQMHSLHDLPVPARLENWLHQLDSLKNTGGGEGGAGSQGNIFAGNWHLSEALYRTLPASLSQPCVVRSKVEDPDLLLERQQLQQTKSIHELSKIRNLNEIPVPGDLIRLPDYPLPKLKNIMQTIARTPQRHPKKSAAAWHNESCPATPELNGGGEGPDSTSQDATSKLYSEISELEDDRRALERATVAEANDDRLLDHDVDYEVIMKPKIIETAASASPPEVNHESFDTFDLAAQVKGTPERNIRNKINKKSTLGNRRSRDTEDENRPASATEVIVAGAEVEDDRPPPLPPKRATPSPKKGMSVESQVSTEEEEYPMRPLKASLQLKVGIQSMPLPAPPAPPRTLKKKGSQDAAGQYDEDDYTIYTEQFKTAADTFNTSKTLVEISSITQKVDEDLTLADSIVDNMVSCAETLVSEHDETMGGDFYSEEDDNPYPSVYFEKDRRPQQTNGSNSGSLKRSAGTTTASRRLEEGTQQLSLELMEHVESLRSTLDNMSSRLGTRSRSRSASRSRSRPRSAYEK